MSTAVILAGGKSRRMGRDKLELAVGGATMLESAVERFSAEFETVYISVSDAAKYPGVRAGRIVDIFAGAGPLSGLHAALASIGGDGVFLVAADLPFAEPAAAKRIISLCGGNDASIIRLRSGLLEPLFGYYRTSLLPVCEAALKSGEYRMTEIINSASVKFVSEDELGSLWDERMFTNINNPNDYEKLGSI